MPSAPPRFWVARWLRRTVTAGAVAAFCAALPSVSVLATASCDGHECDFNWSDYGNDTCQESEAGMATCCAQSGCMLDINTWMSTEPTGVDWINFPANGALRLRLGAWTGNRVPELVGSIIELAPGQGPADPFPGGDMPDNPASYAAPAPGSSGVFSYFSDGTTPTFVEAQNLTCSPNYALIAIRLDPLPDGGAVLDGGSVPDGGATLDGGAVNDLMGPCWKMNPVFCNDN
jgi:hypothetical protein